MKLDEALDILNKQGNIIYELAEIGDNVIALEATIVVATTYIHMINYEKAKEEESKWM